MIKDVKVHVGQLHLCLDDKINSKLPKSSKQCVASLSIYSNMNFPGIRVSQDVIVKIIGTFEKNYAYMDLL